jgi:hypothetical protein
MPRSKRLEEPPGKPVEMTKVSLDSSNRPGRLSTQQERLMSSQSFVNNRPGRRIAAALGASAALSLSLVGPAFSSQPHDPAPSPASAQCQNYVGAGTISSCTTKSSAARGMGAGSSSSADQGLPAPAPAVAPKLTLSSVEPVNVPLPAIGVGLAAAVIAGGLVIASANRRHAA